MARDSKSRLPQLARKNETAIVDEWVRTQLESQTVRRDLLSEADLREDSRMFFAKFSEALQSNDLSGEGPAWAGVRETLGSIARGRVNRGFSPVETATFVFSLKQPLFAKVREEAKVEGEIVDDIWAVTGLVDRLGLYTTEMYQKTREEVILRRRGDRNRVTPGLHKLHAVTFASSA